MGRPKRKQEALESPAKVQDTDTDIVDNLEIADDENDDSDSSVYSELSEGNKSFCHSWSTVFHQFLFDPF